MALRIVFLILLIAAIAVACFTLPLQKFAANILKDFLLWVHRDLGVWGPVALAVAYIPLTIMAVPASILTFYLPLLPQLGGGYLFGLPIGIAADSIGATAGAGAAFLLGRTIGKSFVVSKLKDYPQFRSVAIAIHKSGFKIILLLRLVPLLPFNIMNYLLSVTPISLGKYMLASWLGMMPITVALVYVGTTLKDLSDVTHGWNEFPKSDWAFIMLGLFVSVVLIICITRVAKAALDKALAENEDYDDITSGELPVVADFLVDLKQPLILKIDPIEDNHEK
uniref:VTT domain-containing protein n=1 Tax=Cucumis melo TaxID=3656 RepID=A0A9I9CPI7_CUCME